MLELIFLNVLHWSPVDDVGMFSGSCVIEVFCLSFLHDWSVCEKSVRWLTTIENCVVYSVCGSDHIQSNREFRCHTVVLTVKYTDLYFIISQNMQNKHQLSVTFSFTHQLHYLVKYLFLIVIIITVLSRFSIKKTGSSFSLFELRFFNVDCTTCTHWVWLDCRCSPLN